MAKMREILDILQGDKALQTENKIIFDPATTFMFFALLLLAIAGAIYLYKKL